MRYTLQQIKQGTGFDRHALFEIVDTRREEQQKSLQEIGEGAAECLAEMVNALECDYDRRETLRSERDDWKPDPNDEPGCPATWAEANPDDAAELADIETCAGDCESEDDARERIQEDPLCIELSGTWSVGSEPEAERAYILLGTGGPAVRIVCELDSDMQPRRAWIEAQDWGTAWTEYHGDAISRDQLLKYCSVFYFGEG